MNDKQKELALEMAVQTGTWLASNNGDEMVEAWKKCRELRSAFDLAADPPKRKYTVDDIQRPRLQRRPHGDYWYIRCGDYDWTSDGWCKQPEGSSAFAMHVANVIYAGLVATATLPPEDA